MKIQKKIIYNKIVSFFLMCIILLGQTSYVLAAPSTQLSEEEKKTQEAISSLEKQQAETQNAISALQGQKKEVQNNVNALQNNANALKHTISEYTNQMDDINAQIADAQEKLESTSAEIIEVDMQLQEAQDSRKDAYEKLKLQIKNTYENGGNRPLLEVLLTSSSVQDFLNKAEFVNAIVAYDKKIIANYEAVEAEILERKLELQKKQEELDSYQNTLDEKQQELAELSGEVESQLLSTTGNLYTQKMKLEDYQKELVALDKKMKSLEAQAAAAQAALAKQIAARQAANVYEDTSGSYAASDDELVWLAATIQAEAGGESYTGKLGVGSVIMNRVKSSSFPNTIIGVITQKMQFASYRSGKVELIIANGPNSSCMQAAKESINGARIGNYLFFMTKYYADYYHIAEYTMIGNHAFFYRWATSSTPNVTTDVVTTTPSPTKTPDPSPTVVASPTPTPVPSVVPSASPSEGLSPSTDVSPSSEPTKEPSSTPSEEPSPSPSKQVSPSPSEEPSKTPSGMPTSAPDGENE